MGGVMSGVRDPEVAIVRRLASPRAIVAGSMLCETAGGDASAMLAVASVNAAAADNHFNFRMFMSNHQSLRGSSDDKVFASLRATGAAGARRSSSLTESRSCRASWRLIPPGAR